MKNINFSNSLIIAIICAIATIISMIVVVSIIRHKKKKKMKNAIARLEVEKNKLSSNPVIPELAKVESFLNNEKLEVMYNEWSERLKDIRDVQVPKLADMLLEAPEFDSC